MLEKKKPKKRKDSYARAYKHGLDINEYNLSCHFQRHVEQIDIDEAEATKLRWEKMNQELYSDNDDNNEDDTCQSPQHD